MQDESSSNSSQVERKDETSLERVGRLIVAAHASVSSCSVLINPVRSRIFEYAPLSESLQRAQMKVVSYSCWNVAAPSKFELLDILPTAELRRLPCPTDMLEPLAHGLSQRIAKFLGSDAVSSGPWWVPLGWVRALKETGTLGKVCGKNGSLNLSLPPLASAGLVRSPPKLPSGSHRASRGPLDR